MSEAAGPVVIVDDDADMRESIAFLLSTAGRSSVEFATAEAMLEAGLPPDAVCVIADVRLGAGLDGVALVRALHHLGETIPVIVITGHADVPLAVRAMRAGAVDFVEKPFEPDLLLAAIEDAETLRSGRSRAAASLAASEEAIRLVGALTPREHQVLEALVAGMANKNVAHALGISIRTVETYRASIMDKFGCRFFAQAVRIAVTASVIQHDD